MSSLPKKADKLNLSLSLSLIKAVLSGVVIYVLAYANTMFQTFIYSFGIMTLCALWQQNPLEPIVVQQT